MKLYEFKAKWISELGTHTPENEAERRAIRSIITKLSYLRSMNLPNLAFTVWTAKEDPAIGDELRKKLTKMLEEIKEIEDSDG